MHVENLSELVAYLALFAVAMIIYAIRAIKDGANPTRRQQSQRPLFLALVGFGILVAGLLYKLGFRDEPDDSEPAEQQLSVATPRFNPARWAATPAKFPSANRGSASATAPVRTESPEALMQELQRLYASGAMVGQVYEEGGEDGDRFVVAGRDGWFRVQSSCVVNYCQGPCSHPAHEQVIDFSRRPRPFRFRAGDIGHLGPGRGGGRDLESRYGYRYAVLLDDDGGPADAEIYGPAMPVGDTKSGERIAGIMNRLRDVCRERSAAAPHVTTASTRAEPAPVQNSQKAFDALADEIRAMADAGDISGNFFDSKTRLSMFFSYEQPTFSLDGCSVTFKGRYKQEVVNETVVELRGKYIRWARRADEPEMLKDPDPGFRNAVIVGIAGTSRTIEVPGSDADTAFRLGKLLNRLQASCQQSSAEPSGYAPSPPEPTEPFESFFRRFKSDKEFQLSRIQFPLATEAHEPGEDVVSKGAIERGEWTHLTFKPAGGEIWTAPERRGGDYFVERRQEGSGILITYVFRRPATKWYLVKVIDESA